MSETAWSLRYTVQWTSYSMQQIPYSLQLTASAATAKVIPRPAKPQKPKPLKQQKLEARTLDVSHRDMQDYYARESARKAYNRMKDKDAGWFGKFLHLLDALGKGEWF